MRPASRIMYLELKSGGVDGPAWIGRIAWSKSGRSVYYRGRRLESLAGRGFKANYLDVETGDRWWISGPKRNGRDRLHGGYVEIDEDVREEYWVAVRGMPQFRHLRRYRG